MNPATRLKQLVDSGRVHDAIALCEVQARQDVGRPYYAFWLARLRDRHMNGSDTLQAAARQTARLSGPIDCLARDIGHLFQQHPYDLPAGPGLPPADLEAEKARILAALPFKSPIYLPTSKLGLEAQVKGLARVRTLLGHANLAATKARFDALKAQLKARGKRRIFIVGNGPSLKKTDLGLLADEITIGFNGIFLHDSFIPTIYVVEDHLVAEDRADEIHAYGCPVKVFPSYLAYCIEPQDNTLFLNHQPRISYPVDTDFSADAGNITYTGGTVTYTGLQIAASLGFEEIILVGVDASYRVDNVERSDAYGTGVLTSTAQDVNHFDPRYFGKGYRWHDPNVHTMLQAYRKARNWGARAGVGIVNATLGGQLEVFPRVDFHRLFPWPEVFPRIAVLDFTSVNRLSATGVVKKNLLADWPKASQLHIHCDEKARLIAFQSIAQDLYAAGSDDNSVWPAFRSLVEFDPQVLYLRPTLDHVPMTILQVVAATVLGRPWLVHYMDDWLEKSKSARSPQVAAAYASIMSRLFSGAHSVMSICPKMSRHLVHKYALRSERVHAIHNFLQPNGTRQARPKGGPRLRKVVSYFGGLEPDMGLSTIVEVARQIEAFNGAQDRFEVVFEITARKSSIDRYSKDFASLKASSLHVQTDDYGTYLNRLASSDLNLICYNFDARSVDYVRYSLANKLPELLSANVPFLAIGSAEIGTMELLAQTQYPLTLTAPDFRIADALRFAFDPSEAELQGYRQAVSLLKDECSEEQNKYGLYGLFRTTARASAEQSRRGPRLDYPLQDIMVLHESVRAQLIHSRDIDLLIRLPLLGDDVLGPALHRIRTHGLEWSVRDEQRALAKEIRSVRDLDACGDDVRARAIAFLVCGLGLDRYKGIGDIVRAWLQGVQGKREVAAG